MAAPGSNKQPTYEALLGIHGLGTTTMGDFFQQLTWIAGIKSDSGTDTLLIAAPGQNKRIVIRVLSLSAAGAQLASFKDADGGTLLNPRFFLAANGNINFVWYKAMVANKAVYLSLSAATATDYIIGYQIEGA